MPSQKASSRVIKKEKSRMWKQTFYFVLAGAGIFIFFLFIVLPDSTRLLGLFSDRTISQNDNSRLPPQAPVLQAPIEATFSAQLVVAGLAQPESKVVLVVNGKELSPTTADDDGQFEKTVSLTAGENSITSFSYSDQDNQSADSKTYIVVLDNEPPEVVLDGITDGQTIVGKQNGNLKLSGLTEPRTKVTINDRFVFARSDGSFSQTIQLAEGDNLIKITALDEAGNSSERELKIIFKP